MHTGRREEGGEAWPTARANVERQRRKGLKRKTTKGQLVPGSRAPEQNRTEEREGEREREWVASTNLHRGLALYPVCT